MESTIGSTICGLLALCVFVSCNSVTTDDRPPGEIRFSAQIPRGTSTRLTTENDLRTHFDDGDAIGVYAVRRTNPLVQAPLTNDLTTHYLSNVKYVYNASAQLFEPDNNQVYTYLPGDGVLDFYVYYPYTTVAGSYPTNIMNSYLSSAGSGEILTARASNVTKSSAPLPLTFQHKLAMLEVRIPDADLFYFLKVTLVDVNHRGTFNLTAASQDNEFTTNTSVKNNIVMEQHKPGYFRLFLPPQMLASNKQLLYIEANSDTYDHTIALEEELGAGVAKVYNLALMHNEDNLANCYMVKPGGRIDIPAARAYTEWRSNPLLLAQNPDLYSDPEPVILWQENPNNISYMEVNKSQTDAVITLYAGAQQGNAVIGVIIDGKVRWSWHIWVTDYDPFKDYVSYVNPANGKTYHFMDRNLGAIVKGNGSKSYGMMYQWGRKDPFPGSAVDENQNGTYTHYPVYGPSGSSITLPVPERSAEPFLANSIYNPTIFYFNPSPPYDWYTDSAAARNDFLWNNVDGSKTVFDPCPAGWRVPAEYNKQSPFLALTSQNAPWTAYGRTVTAKNDHWPASGIRDNSDGRIYSAGLEGYYWSSMPADQTGAGWLGFTKTLSFATAVRERANGVNIRCVKDIYE